MVQLGQESNDPVGTVMISAVAVITDAFLFPHHRSTLAGGQLHFWTCQLLTGWVCWSMSDLDDWQDADIRAVLTFRSKRCSATSSLLLTTEKERSAPVRRGGDMAASWFHWSLSETEDSMFNRET